MADELDIMDAIETAALGGVPLQRRPVAKPMAEAKHTEEITPMVAAFEAKGIRIRGDVDEPLLCCADSATYIGDTNYLQKIKKYTIDEHIKILETTDIRGQRRQMRYFTEYGFYKYMTQSKGEKAEEFQRFVYDLLRTERKRTVDSVKLALKIAQTEADELRKEKASFERRQTSVMRAANDAREQVTSLKAEVKSLRRSKNAAADAEEMRLMGRGSEQVKGWNC